jgi:DNA repair protein RadC
MNTCQEADYLAPRENGREIRTLLPPGGPLDEVPNATTQLALLLVPAVAGKAEALALARTLLAAFGSVAGVLNARPDRLATIPGMTTTAQSSIAAAYALACEAAAEKIVGCELIGDRAELMDFLRVKLRGRSTEAALALFLDRRNRLIELVPLNEGTVDQVMVYPREIVRMALVLDASAVILVHNHPSGDATPSDADITMTRRVAQALASVDVALHDHVIIGDHAVASVRKVASL